MAFPFWLFCIYLRPAFQFLVEISGVFSVYSRKFGGVLVFCETFGNISVSDNPLYSPLKTANICFAHIWGKWGYLTGENYT